MFYILSVFLSNVDVQVSHQRLKNHPEDLILHFCDFCLFYGILNLANVTQMLSVFWEFSSVFIGILSIGILSFQLIINLRFYKEARN